MAKATKDDLSPVWRKIIDNEEWWDKQRDIMYQNCIDMLGNLSENKNGQDN